MVRPPAAYRGVSGSFAETASCTASRERELPRKELSAIMSATGIIGYPFGNLYRLMLLTGKRKGEVARMRWQDIDLDAAEWTIQSSQTNSEECRTVSATVVALFLSSLARITPTSKLGNHAFLETHTVSRCEITPAVAALTRTCVFRSSGTWSLKESV